jgi:hypothetical protein
MLAHMAETERTPPQESETAAGENALAAIRGDAKKLVEGQLAPYDAGWRMWSAAMTGVSPGPAGEHCHALWLFWGALTDWWEEVPEEREVAESTMRRAAAEWLAVAENESERRSFCDRWWLTELARLRPLWRKYGPPNEPGWPL